MARYRHFSDINGETVELFGYHGMLPNKLFAERFPGVKGKRADSSSMWVGYIQGSRDMLPLTRSIKMKSNPSKHECDARCVNATGKVMHCECSCGGKNHGKGSFVCD